MKDIICLAIESSCDETSMSIIKNGCEEIATVVLTQIDIHKVFGLKAEASNSAEYI